MNGFSRILILTCMLAVNGVAQSTSDAERDLEAAINKEVVQGDINSAIGLYRNILTRYGSQRQIAAQALLHLAQCQERLGQAAEARKSYQRVVNEFADQKQVIALAQSRLAQLGEKPGHSGIDVRVQRAPTEETDCLACTHDDGIYLRNPSTGQETLLVQDWAGFARSLDRRWVAYRTSGEALWLVATDGNSRRQIKVPDNRLPRQLMFTDDGSALVVLYRHPGEEIWSYPVQGGEGRKLYESSKVHKDLDHPSFSPDGRLAAYGVIAVEGTAKSVLFISMTGGESWEMQIQPDENPVGFTVDNKIVVHSPQRFGSPALWTLSVEQGHPGGKPELFHRVPAKGAYRNGNYYYYLNGRRREMLSLSLDAVPPLPVREIGQGMSPDFSADGKFLAWGSPDDTGRLIVRNLESGADKEFNTPLKRLTSVRWYPDGSGLLAIGSTQTQNFAGVKIDVTSGNIFPVRLPRMGWVIPSLNPTLSQDGRYIYYKRRSIVDIDVGLVQRYDLSNNAEENLYFIPKGIKLRRYSISPDGRQIATICSDKEGRSASNWIEIAPLAGGKAKRIYQTGPGEEIRDFYGLAWAADGASVFFLTHAESNEGEALWRVSLDGSPAQRLLKRTGTTAGLAYNERLGSMAVRPDGREIILGLTEGGWEHWVMEGLK